MTDRSDSATVPDPAAPDLQDPGNTGLVNAALSRGHARILGYLQRRLGNTEDAADVMQAFMLRALGRAEALRDGEALHGWLSRLLATSIADHQRGAARRRQREVVMGPEFFDDTPAEAAERDAAICECLHELLAVIKPDHAELIRRIDLNEEPRTAVAADLGLSVPTLGVRLHRARHALKQRLVEMCLTCPEHGFLDCGCDTARKAAVLRAAAAPD